MKILIVDDEPLAVSRLKRVLGELGEYDVKSASRLKEAIESCKSELFDVAFLDIALADGDGTELAADLLSINNNLSIVFQTAHDSYALKAFEIGAVDYLLKPYSKEQLKNTLDRLKKRESKSSRFFLVRDDNDYVTVYWDDIYYIEAELSHSVIRTKEMFLYYPKKISQMDELLSPHGFFRIHRSIVINTAKIKKISTSSQSRLLFEFDGIDESIESSKDGAKLFRQKYLDR